MNAEILPGVVKTELDDVVKYEFALDVQQTMYPVECPRCKQMTATRRLATAPAFPGRIFATETCPCV